MQSKHAATPELCLAGAAELALKARRSGAELLLFPEYFFMPVAASTRRPDFESLAQAPDFLRDLSREMGVGIGGNSIRRSGRGFRNVALLFDRGRLVLSQEKLRPMPRERAWGVTGGKSVRVARFRGVDVAFVICADILFPAIAGAAAEAGARILLNPVMSPNRPRDHTRSARESMYVARAYDNAAFVLKAAGFALRERRLVVAGRSLMVGPWGVVSHYESERRAEVLVADLDLARLEEVRASHPAIAAGARL
ncbi:MAG: carbon-nitrogen hydrolase family protein [Euryarchaeota archaeon]|nr:carbon-nitrogen hydrolase family protein [Euryarchaeota archaeon]